MRTVAAKYHMKKSFEKVSKAKQLHFLNSLYFSYFTNRPMSLFSIALEVTYRCNATCSFCSRWKSNKEMQFSLIEKVLIQAKKLGCWYVSLTGGEPLLYKDFSKILELAQRINLQISIETNGLLLNEYSETLLKYRNVLFGINVSIHSDNPDIHNRTIGHSNGYQIILEGIKKLKDKINLKIASTITKDNCNGIDEIANMAEKLGVSYRFQPVHNEVLGDLKPWKDDGRFDFDETARKKISEHIKLHLLKYNVEYKLRIYYELFPEFLAGRKKLKELKCIMSGRKIYYISPEGRVFPCESRRDIILGDISKNSLKEILSSKKARQWRKICKEGKNRCSCFYACVAPMNLIFEFFPWLIPFNLQNGFPINFFWDKKLQKIKN